MSLSDHPKAYGTAAVAVAFVAGVCVTLGFKDLYPDLQRRYEQGSSRRAAPATAVARRRQSTASTATTSSTARRRRSSFFWAPVRLEDHESPPSSVPPAAGSAAASSAEPPPIAHGIEATIGNTPLVEIRSLSAATGRTILAKAEFLNGAGNSPKDRVALNLIREAEAAGLLVPGRGDTIYEGTSGSTGISLATLARAMGYRAHICMSDDQSVEKAQLLHHLGATVERVPVAPITDPGHFVNRARSRAREHCAAADAAADKATASRGFFADQFESAANYRAHQGTTGPEILAQTGGEIDAFVAGAGTGGTVTGVAKYLKEDAGLRRSVRVVVADPHGSGLYNKVKYGVMYSHTEKEGTRRRTQVDSVVEGIGMNRLTAVLAEGLDLIDDAVAVSDEQAERMGRWLVEKDGIFVGSSSCVNCVAAVATALTLPEGSRVVTVLCDSGARHLSKFWKNIAEAGLEEQEDADEDLLKILGLEKKD
ncbi:uncharacterized protein E0L32_009490 [Thyridium curvatum]|uniref:Cysteine synthase 2 n=1 Tax=Thyridium curvatum TaxID=1093900 RepID=A0A507AWU3_9PEZI|nr:uncharacterized protein E0L32_009490 [Thyridium curvatum]TPX09298.1 hypothetical protein E0L32_009490 [Thyridium curvatum]